MRALKSSSPFRASAGMTLLELLVVLVVASVVLSAGVPGFFDLVRNNRAATHANELVTALSLARSEAVRRAARVSVCQSADGATCGNAGWAQGWIVFADGAASDAAAPIVSQILQVWPALSGNPSLTPPSSMQWVRFLPRGEVRAPVALPVVYDLQVEGCSGEQGRRIELNAVGRTTVTRTQCT